MAVNYLIVFIAGGMGCVLRFLIGPAVQQSFSGWIFPIGTFCVNMMGCFIIGFLGEVAESKGLLQPEVRLALFVGLLGGFTTFSSFGYETFQLIRDGQYFFAAFNAVLQVVVGLALVWLGYVVGRLL